MCGVQAPFPPCCEHVFLPSPGSRGFSSTQDPNSSGLISIHFVVSNR